MYFEALTKAKTKEIASLTNAPHEAEVAKAKKDCRDGEKRTDESSAMRLKDNLEYEQQSAPLAKYQEYLNVDIADKQKEGSAKGGARARRDHRLHHQSFADTLHYTFIDAPSHRDMKNMMNAAIAKGNHKAGEIQGPTH